MTRLKNAKAFTLIELIVVIVIIGILAAIAAFAYNQFIAQANENSAQASAESVSSILAATGASSNTAPSEATFASGVYTFTPTATVTLPADVEATANGATLTVESGSNCAVVNVAGANTPGSIPVVSTGTVAADGTCDTTP